MNLHTVTEVLDSATLPYAAIIVVSASTDFIPVCTSTMLESGKPPFLSTLATVASPISCS